MARRKKANYNSNPNYLDYLTALRKFFTNDTDIIPIIESFNFYINGVYGIPYTDLFRIYDENMNDIHGEEKTKQLIDEGTIGIINNQIYNIGGGSLITSLETLRVYMEDRRKKYTIAYNPFINAYAESITPVINVLETANPVVTTNGIDNSANTSVDVPLGGSTIEKEIRAAQAETTAKKQRKSFWKHLAFLSYKNSARYKKQNETKETYTA
jgi:hypothetical protein